MNKCPVCSSQNLVVTDRLENGGVVFDIATCLGCASSLNLTAYEILERRQDIRDIQKTDFYDISSLRLDELINEVDIHKLNLENLFKRTEFSPAGKSFLDFGAGRGCTSAAACSYFKKVYAVDYSPSVVERTFELLDVGDKAVVATDFDSFGEKFDFVFAWHVIEHLPNPVRVLRTIADSMSDSGIIAIQIPKFRVEHVIDCHYVFYNRFSLPVLLRACDIRTLDVMDDYKHHFLTVLGTKALGEASVVSR